MTDEPDNLILQHLRALRAGQDSIRADVREMTMRIGALERSNAELHRSVAGLHETLAEQSSRMDRIGDRLDRIERRLDLVETT